MKFSKPNFFSFSSSQCYDVNPKNNKKNNPLSLRPILNKNNHDKQTTKIQHSQKLRDTFSELEI